MADNNNDGSNNSGSLRRPGKPVHGVDIIHPAGTRFGVTANPPSEPPGDPVERARADLRQTRGPDARTVLGKLTADLRDHREAMERLDRETPLPPILSGPEDSGGSGGDLGSSTRAERFARVMPQHSPTTLPEFGQTRMVPDFLIPGNSLDAPSLAWLRDLDGTKVFRYLADREESLIREIKGNIALEMSVGRRMSETDKMSFTRKNAANAQEIVEIRALASMIALRYHPAGPKSLRGK